jgi:hypothetical protein
MEMRIYTAPTTQLVNFRCFMANLSHAIYFIREVLFSLFKAQLFLLPPQNVRCVDGFRLAMFFEVLKS